MKNLMSLLISISFIIGLSFSAFAQDQTTIPESKESTTNQVTPIKQQTPPPTISSDKIGLNIKGFFGIGDMTVREEPDHPKNIYREEYSEDSFPSYNLSVSYQIVKILPTLGLELGASYQYNTIKFETEKLSNDGEHYKDYSYKIKLHQFGLDTTVTSYFKYVDVYVGITLFPFINIESVGRSDTPILAIGAFVGVSYNVYSCINLLAQLSSESSSSVSMKDQNNQDFDKAFSLSNILLGVGISL